MKIFGIIFIMLLLTIVVVAQENLPLEEPEENLTSELNEIEEVAMEDQKEVTIEEPETEAGTIPDSLFYGLDKAFERINLALTFDKAEKAKRRLKIASERIAELRVMIKKGKQEFTEKLIEEYNEEIEEAEEDIEKAKALGKNVTLLREHVTEMTSKHIIVLQEVLEKVPEQAKLAIEKAINKSIERRTKVREKEIEEEEVVEEEVEEEVEEAGEAEEEVEACVDTDAGDDKYTPGTVTYVNKDYIDECYATGSGPKKRLKERYCVVGRITTKRYVCGNGCAEDENGVGYCMK